MNILALDPSTKATGYALYKDGKLEKHGVLRASQNDARARIKRIVKQLMEILEGEHIDIVVYEDVRPDDIAYKNERTRRPLTWVQGGLVLSIFDVFPNAKNKFYYPSEWRAKCGIKNGRGVKRDQAKAADIQFVRDTFGLDVCDDEADAIGIGYAYIIETTKTTAW